jgi:hypothetical protein
MALRLYIETTRRQNAEGKSWIRQPNNFISAVAIILSLLSIGYQVLKDRNDGIDKNLAALSAIVSELTKMDSDMLTTSIKDPQLLDNLSIYVTNRRVALLAEADRLIESLGKRAPHAQLAVLGPEYLQIYDYKTGVKYLRMMTVPPSAEPEQLGAWRSLGIAYFSQGAASLGDARDAFQHAVEIYPEPHDVGSIVMELAVHEQWAQLELTSSHYSQATEQFGDALKLSYELPCSPARSRQISRIAGEADVSLVALRSQDSQGAEKVRQSWTALEAADKCPRTSVQQTTQQQGQRASGAEMTTVCKFNQGARSSQTEDFAPYGVQPIAVGAACTDGLGSYGVGVRQ